LAQKQKTSISVDSFDCYTQVPQRLHTRLEQKKYYVYD